MVDFKDSVGKGSTGENEAYPVHALLMQWLIFATVLAISLWIAWQHQLVQDVVRTDPTGLSLVIAAIFFGGTAHCAARSLFLSSQLNELGVLVVGASGLRLDGDRLCLGERPVKRSLVSDYVAGVWRRRLSGGVASRFEDVLVEKATGTHETGWFFAGLLIKLGLLGTVIGFILMLTSVSGSLSFDPSEVHVLFSEMTRGMRVALDTTLVGLLGTMLLGFQYLMLDRGADRLLSNTVSFAERLCRDEAGRGAQEK